MGDNVWTTTAGIKVERNGTHVWTPWHRERTNRLDCWILDLDGHVKLFQVGVITHDDGVTFRLLGEFRWEGQLFWHPDLKCGVIGKPDDPKWGNFDVRRTILDHPDFKKLLESATLQSWEGKEEELDPPLDPIPEPGTGRMQWYVPFAGQTGQGPVTLFSGKDAWVHGSELMIEPDPDGIKRLDRNDPIRYAGIQKKWGSKSGPPKLLCVERL